MLPGVEDVKTVILDNGAGYIKACHLARPSRCFTAPNAAVRHRNKLLVADEIFTLETTYNKPILRPFKNGILVNRPLQKAIWKRIFNVLEITPLEYNLVLTETPLNINSVRKGLFELVFKTFKFKSLMLTAPSTKVIFGDNFPNLNKNCCLVIDSGFSATHITPLVQNTSLNYAIQRINIGSDKLTKILKENVSFRQIDIRKDYFLAEKIRLNCCTKLSKNFKKDLFELKNCKEKEKMKVILPNGFLIKNPIFFKDVNKVPLQIRQSEPQLIILTNESITIPEILFHPSDVDVDEAGLAESIVNSVQKTPKPLWRNFYENIIITGGNCNTANFSQKLKNELSELIESHFAIRIFEFKNPSQSNLKGLVNFLKNMTEMEKKRHFVTASQYFKFGAEFCLRRLEFLN